jgi:hypothetical protein
VERNHQTILPDQSRHAHYNETKVEQMGLKGSLKDKDGNCVDLNAKIIYKRVAQNMVCGRYVMAANIFLEI